MGKKWGLCAFLILALIGCDNGKDLPLISRYIAKNVCGAIWQEGYSESAAIDYVSNIAPPLKNSWTIMVADQASVSVRNNWFAWLNTETAMPIVSGEVSACRNDYAGVSRQASTHNDSSQKITSYVKAEFVDVTNQHSEIQNYLKQVIAVGAPEYTTAILVLHRNQVVGEVYRDGIGAASALKGFSMSKSFANLLVGRLADQQRLNVNEPMLLADWSTDERGAISWDDSLRMSSGLLWHEAAIGADNDQGQMLYNNPAPSVYARTRPLAVQPGSEFNYSSGDYMNIATGLVQTQDWFDPGWYLGETFALEYGPTGQIPLLAEGVYLTTRGWAAMASLYMHGGVLAGQRVLSAEWVDYSLRPSATNFDYGAGIWLNRGQSLFPGLPADTFAFIGSYDRYTVALPQHDVVVVRFGFSAQPGDFDMQDFILNILDRLPPE